MDDTPEIIRQQMEETKSQISEKLESLELQVAETVQSTGTAVNETVEAVQATVETVTTAVQDAVHSVGNAFDLGRQINKHPLLVLGGSIVLGYLAVEFLSGSAKEIERQPHTVPPPLNNAGPQNDASPVETAPTASALAAAYESGRESSSWHRLREMAIGAMIGAVQDLTSRAIPRIVDYLADHSAGNRSNQSESINEIQDSPRRKESPEATGHRQVTSLENGRFSKEIRL